MRKLLIILVVLCGCQGAYSQIVQSIVFTNISSRVGDEKLTIDIDVMAQGLNLGSGGRIVLEFAIENQTQRMALPMIVYSSPLRTRLEKRRQLLSDEYAPESYYTYDRVKRRESYNLHYKIDVPYQTWMSGAGLTAREYTHTCSADRLTSTARLIEEFGQTPSQRKAAMPPKVVYVIKEVPVEVPQTDRGRIEFSAPENCQSCREQAKGIWEYRRRNR